ncbi:peptidase S8/S53 domain-containing protein, partial [Xylogone sp. PMI_703]
MSSCWRSQGLFTYSLLLASQLCVASAAINYALRIPELHDAAITHRSTSDSGPGPYIWLVHKWQCMRFSGNSINGFCSAGYGYEREGAVIGLQYIQCCPNLIGEVEFCLVGAECDPTLTISDPALNESLWIIVDDSSAPVPVCVDPPGKICGCNFNDVTSPETRNETPEQIGLCRSVSDWQCCGGRATDSAFWCPSSSNCGTTGPCNGTQATTVVSSYDTFNSIGCYGDLGNSRTLRNGSSSSSDMTVEKCVQFAISGGWQYAGVENGNECYVGNTLFNEAEPQGCNSPCAGAPHEICGGNSRINIYQDITWKPPSLDYLNTVLPQWIDNLDALQQAVSVWYNLLIDSQSQTTGSNQKRQDTGTSSAVTTAYSVVISRQQATQQSSSEALRAFTQAEQNGLVWIFCPFAETIEMQNLADMTNALFTDINSITASADVTTSLSVAADVIERIGARALVAAANEEVVFTSSRYLSNLIRCSVALAAVLFGQTGGGSSTSPPPPSTTSSAPTGDSTPYYFYYTNDMSQAQFDQITASVIKNGGSVIENFSDNDIKWFSFNAELFDSQVPDILSHPLLEAACLDAFVTFDNEQHNGSGIGPESNEELESLLNVTTHGGKWRKRAIPGNAVLVDAPLTSPGGLTVLDIPQFFFDEALFDNSIIVYVLDTGIDPADSDFAAGQISEQYDYVDKPIGVNRPIVDNNGHGTAVASLIAGTIAGVNRAANLIPIRFDARISNAQQVNSSVKTLSRAFPGILKLHKSKGNPKAIINISFGMPAFMFSQGNKFVSLLEGSKADPFPKFLQECTAANIAVVMSAGNDAATNPDLTQSSPRRWAKSSTPYVVVGAADQNGKRAPFSNYVDPAGAGILSLYNLGVNVVSALAGGNTFFKAQSGTSHATALTSGVLSILMSQGLATASSAKSVLQNIGTQKKGLNWPADVQGLPVIPRAATNHEITCPAGMSPSTQSPFRATFANGANQLYQFGPLALDDYTTESQK